MTNNIPDGPGRWMSDAEIARFRREKDALVDACIFAERYLSGARGYQLANAVANIRDALEGVERLEPPHLTVLDPAKCEHPSPKVRVGKRASWFTEECECGAWRQLLYGKNPWNPPEKDDG